MPTLEQHFGGARYTESATDFTLNWSGAKVHTINATATGVDVTMPSTSAYGLAAGSTFYLVNGGAETFTAKTSGGATIATCPTGEALRLRILGDGSWASEQMDSDGQPPDDDPPAGEVLATVTAYETRTGYNLIRGTIPVPESRTPSSLFLRDEDGVPWPTEVRTVMRGPTGAPRILELRAYVDVPSPGGVRYFDVEAGLIQSSDSFHDHVTVTLYCEAPDSAIGGEITPGTSTYSARLLQGGVGSNTGAAGDVTRTIIRSGEMRAPTGSRLWGFRAHITTIAGAPDVWLVNMTVQNANVGNPGSPLGSAIQHDVFFNEIRMEVTPPAGSGLTDSDYSVIYLHPTPYTVGKKIMTPESGGKLHALMQGGAKAYRFVLYRSSSPSQIGVASTLIGQSGFFVCDHSYTLWSWSNPSTSWYGPQNLPVPQINLSTFNAYGTSYTNIKDGLEDGTAIGFEISSSAPLGPYHVKGPTAGGPGSGTEITQFKGYEVVNTGSGDKLKVHMAVLSMQIDRSASKISTVGAVQDTGVYICDANQAPIRASDWTLSSFWADAYPGQMNSSKQGPWPRLNANRWRLNHATANSLLPTYYSSLGNYELYKDSHMIRALASTIPLICLLNDPIAKDYLAHFSTWSRAASLEYGGGSTDSKLWVSYETSDANVQDFPDKGAAEGGFGGRNGGWLIWSQCFDWLVTEDDTKRVAYGPWFSVLTAHEQLAQFKVGSKCWNAYDSGDTPQNNLQIEWEWNGGVGNVNAAASQIMEVGIRAGASLSAYSCTGDSVWLTMLSNACDGVNDYHRAPSSGTYHFTVPVREEDATDPGCEVWATQAAAPNCFTTNNPPGGLGYDDFHVGTFICAALKSDPNHPKAWSMIYGFTGTSTPTDARDDLLSTIAASTTNGKMEHSWGPVLGMIQQIVEA